MEEKFISISDKKYKILEPNQYRHDNTRTWIVAHNAEMENAKLIGLEIRFSSFITRLLNTTGNPLGPLRQDAVNETLRKFKGMLFYDELQKDTVLELFTDNAEHTEDKMIFNDFEVLKTKPFRLKCIGYPNFNADIHTKADNEILRILYERYGKSVDNDTIRQEVWFDAQIIQDELDALRKVDRVSQPSSQNYKLTLDGKDYYEKFIRQNKSLVSKSNVEEWDFFICHASEDKKDAAVPIYNGLLEKGYKVWFDKFELKLGDSLRKKIDEGLRGSKYGIVILSSYFFEKKWPQNELDGLVALEQDGKKRILPIWHNLGFEDVKKYSPILAGRLAAKTSEGIEIAVDKIIKAIID
jgi:hypothetical protein